MPGPESCGLGEVGALQKGGGWLATGAGFTMHRWTHLQSDRDFAGHPATEAIGRQSHPSLGAQPSSFQASAERGSPPTLWRAICLLRIHPRKCSSRLKNASTATCRLLLTKHLGTITETG